SAVRKIGTCTVRYMVTKPPSEAVTAVPFHRACRPMAPTSPTGRAPTQADLLRDRDATPRASPTHAVKSTCAKGETTARSTKTVATAASAPSSPAAPEIVEPK